MTGKHWSVFLRLYPSARWCWCIQSGNGRWGVIDRRTTNSIWTRGKCFRVFEGRWATLWNRQRRWAVITSEGTSRITPTNRRPDVHGGHSRQLSLSQALRTSWGSIEVLTTVNVCFESFGGKMSYYIIFKNDSLRHSVRLAHPLTSSIGFWN